MKNQKIEIGFLSIFVGETNQNPSSMTAESYSDCECYGTSCDCDGSPSD